MQATADGTTRYADRYPNYRDADFYRTAFDLRVSSLGIGTYLGGTDEASDRAYTDALIAAGERGVNFFDTAINYRNQRSERCIGAALRRLKRDEIVVCTKAGYLTPGAIPSSLKPDDVVGGKHSMAPHFLADQIERSRANLGVDTIDVFYLHSPETQLGRIAPGEFEKRIRRAFALLEQQAEDRKIRWYGMATWDYFRKPGALNLDRLAEIAIEEGGPNHRFRFFQLPFNLAMVEAYGEGGESVLKQAVWLGLTVVASATLMQGRVLGQMPNEAAALLSGLETDAQRAIQFTRSTPGISVALVGMGRAEHVEENLGVARVRPATLEEYQRLYQ